mmetsp:Transcript_3673/g.10349  ORF Transcript_3673/g.10349 Transcript_3673/m.10349 type:complete len:236 (-) Transcript_3673:796-1503(-)
MRDGAPPRTQSSPKASRPDGCREPGTTSPLPPGCACISECMYSSCDTSCDGLPGVAAGRSCGAPCEGACCRGAVMAGRSGAACRRCRCARPVGLSWPRRTARSSARRCCCCSCARMPWLVANCKRRKERSRAVGSSPWPSAPRPTLPSPSMTLALLSPPTLSSWLSSPSGAARRVGDGASSSATRLSRRSGASSAAPLADPCRMDAGPVMSKPSPAAANGADAAGGGGTAATDAA